MDLPSGKNPASGKSPASGKNPASGKSPASDNAFKKHTNIKTIYHVR
jgi:hypothetical protein